MDTNGQAKLLHSDVDIRFAQEPFPLYPGEVLKQTITPLKVIEPNCALRLRAVLDFVDEHSQQIRAGDEFLFHGPGREEFSLIQQIRLIFRYLFSSKRSQC